MSQKQSGADSQLFNTGDQYTVEDTIAAVAPRVIDAFAQLAAPKTSLTRASMDALECLTRLRLHEIVAALRTRLVVEAKRADGEREHWGAIDLPHALRNAVHRQRHGAETGAA